MFCSILKQESRLREECPLQAKAPSATASKFFDVWFKGLNAVLIHTPHITLITSLRNMSFSPSAFVLFLGGKLNSELTERIPDGPERPAADPAEQCGRRAWRSAEGERGAESYLWTAAARSREAGSAPREAGSRIWSADRQARWAEDLPQEPGTAAQGLGGQVRCGLGAWDGHMLKSNYSLSLICDFSL